MYSYTRSLFEHRSIFLLLAAVPPFPDERPEQTIFFYTKIFRGYIKLKTYTLILPVSGATTFSHLLEFMQFIMVLIIFNIFNYLLLQKQLNSAIIISNNIEYM